ncbi:MAG TPA: ParB N-terminal domain-containing protein [Candidatus Polarisedimenticolia bacterium]|nr:ParB N-terminal domain-containing protein [Candidatus Polarisedimenticolia bacterium]
MTSLSLATFPTGEDPPRGIRALAEQVAEDGGVPLAAYREPVGRNWQIFAILPLNRVKPTPYQRDISKTHLERLRKVIAKLDRFVDPVVAVRGADGAYWTPNGNHRRTALEKMKAATIPVILLAEPEVAFQILALNTEKAHNLKEKSMEVIRMYRGLLGESGRKSEESFAFQFEEAYYATLGLLYEAHPRFAGGAFGSILRRVDKFLKDPLSSAYKERERRAALVEKASGVLDRQVEKVKRRGIRHPFVKNFVLARCNPLTRARKTLPSFDTALRRLTENLEKFDADTVRYDDVARAGVMVAAASGAGS